MIDAHGRYIYHMCPRQMMGATLHPLNHLKTLAPEVYQREIAKYNDHPSRQALPDTWLPGLDCRWNDVIHCSSIHPHLLYEEWSRHLDWVDPTQRFFAIPIETVSHLTLGVMRPAMGGETRDVSLITADHYIEITDVPDETRAWYARLAGKDRFGGHFVGVPHILVQGSIDTSGMQTIRWSDTIAGR